MSSVQRVLVTGSSGFIGSHLVDDLCADGSQVTGLDLAAPRHPQPPGVRTLRVDIRAQAAVAEAIGQERPHVVYHLAAQTSVSASVREPVVDAETNVLGTLHVARAAAAVGVERLVFVSTGGALYGDPDTLPVTAQTPPAPASVYGLSKWAAERYLPLVAPTLPLSVVRPGNVYGPRQDGSGEAGVVAIFTRLMLAGRPVTIFGDGAQQRDYVFVADVVRAIRAAAAHPPATALVGTGSGVSTADIFRRLARLTGYEAAAQYAPSRPGDIERIALDPADALRRWAWGPTTDLDVGLMATVDWYRHHRLGGG